MQTEPPNNLSSSLNVEDPGDTIPGPMKFHYQKQVVKNLLAIAGDRNKFQILTLLILSIICLVQTFFLNALAYIFYTPVYTCLNPHGEEMLCSKEQACENEYGFKIMSDIQSLNMKFELVCDNEYKAILGPIIIVVVSGILSCLLIFLTDFIGRKMMFNLTAVVQCTGLMVAFFIPNYEIIIIGLTIAYTGLFSWFANCYVYLNEIMGGPIRVYSVPLLFTVCSIGRIFTHWVAEYLSDYRVFLMSTFVSIFLSAFLYIYFLSSPFFLYRFSTLGKMYSCLKQILFENYTGEKRDQRLKFLKSMLFNYENDLKQKNTQIREQNVNDDRNLEPIELDNISIKTFKPNPDQLSEEESKDSGELDEIREEKSETDTKFNSEVLNLTLKKSFADSKTRSKVNNYSNLFTLEYGLPFLGIITLSLPLFIGDSLTLYSIQNLGVKSVSMAGIYMGIFELIGNILAIIYSPLVARKNTNIICQILIFLAVSCLIIIDYNHNYITNSFNSSWTFEFSQAIFCLIIRLAISFNLSTIFTYNMELFPTYLRIITLSIMLFFKQMVMGVSGYLISETIIFHFHPVCSLFLFSVITMPLAYTLPNTDHKGISN
jgi:hypothetical protein